MLTHHENVKADVAFVPQNVNNSAVNGADINEPWKVGRNLAFHLVAGAMVATDALTITVQGKKRSDSAYEAVKDKDGNNLIFTVTKTSDGGALENGHLLGTVDLERFDGNKYSDIRLSAINAVALNVLLAAAYEISDPHARPTGQVDDLLSKQAEAYAA